jgi:short-subunit dehydrogenase
MNHPWRGQWALVTGASAGIGLALAEELAEGGAHLVLTARRAERLDQLADQLRAKHGISVETVVGDLEDPQTPQRLYAFTEEKGIAVEVLVNNAGFGAYGEFQTSHLDRQVAMVQVNCAAVVHLTRLYLPAMIERRRGAILILASTAAYQAVAYISTYAATKAFDLSFAEGLAEEVRRYGVRVCALCPGSTESEFTSVAGAPGQHGLRTETAEQVARVGLRALAQGKHSVISGFINRMNVELQRLAPRRLVTATAERIFRPKHLR